MKLFWWSAPDVLHTASPRLYSIDLQDSIPSPTTHWDVNAFGEILAALMSEGYTEISYRTAHRLAWPI